MSQNWPEKLSLARLNTPIQRLESLEQEFELSAELYVKRDDLTGCLLTGNKIRKLEYLLKSALEQDAQAIITCGGIQSNHCRATAIASRQLGLAPSLVLRGQRPSTPLTGNLLLNVMVGAKIRWITPEEYKDERQQIMEQEAARLADQGIKAMIIPEGGSNALGAFGYVDCVQEIMSWQQEQQQQFDWVTHAIGSGGTAAGLHAGKQIHGAAFKVMGFPVCDDCPTFAAIIKDILTELRVGYELDLDDSLPQLEDAYKGIGYAQSTPEEDEFLLTVARRAGLFLDPCYTGKAFRGVIEEIKQGRFARPDGAPPKLLFIHTGGVFGTLARAWPSASNPSSARKTRRQVDDLAD